MGQAYLGMKEMQLSLIVNTVLQNEKQFGTEDQISGEWDGSQETYRLLDSNLGLLPFRLCIWHL